MNGDPSADDTSLVGPDRVRMVVQGLLRAAQARGWTDEALGVAAHMKPRRIKAYRVEDKEPSLSAALSIAHALGDEAVNAVLSLIGYGGATRLDGPDTFNPLSATANAMGHLAVIARAAADGRIDHVEAPACRLAADALIAEIVPLSSAARN